MRSISSSSSDTAGHCPRCDGPIAYCHGHESPEPLPIRPTIRVSYELGTGPISQEHHERIHRIRRGIVQALNEIEDEEVDDENTSEVPEGGEDAERVGPGQEANYTVTRDIQALWDEGVRRGIFHPPNTSTTQAAPERPISPTPEGYDLNVAHHYVPLRIPGDDDQLVVAKYVKVYMTDNPYAEGRMHHDSRVYRGEIHAAPSMDVDPDMDDYTYESLRTLREDYPDRQQVDNAIARLHDPSLAAEVHRLRATSRRMKTLSEQLKVIEDEQYSLALLQNRSISRLQKANGIGRIRDQEEQDQRVTLLTPWTVERGRSG